MFCLTKIIENLSVLPTPINEISCMGTKLVSSCGPAKIYHLWWGIEPQPLISPDKVHGNTTSYFLHGGDTEIKLGHMFRCLLDSM